MKKTLTAIIGILFCITANSQEINAVVTRQGDNGNKSHYQLGEAPKFVLDGDNINVTVGKTQKEQFSISADALNVIFGSVINDNVNENDLIVKHPVIIESNGILTVTGAMINTKAEDLVIEDGGQLATGSSVHATLEKEITGSTPSKASDVNWYTISSPLAAEKTAFANVTNLIPSSGVTGTDYDLYRLDEKKGEWVNSRLSSGPNSEFETLNKGIGYIYHREESKTLEFKGEINVSNVTDVSLTLTAEKGKGFNLIGNPFTQNITLNDITTTPSEGLIVIDNKGTSDLADGFYVLSNHNTWETMLTTDEIKPLQGFLVQAKGECSATINRPASGSKGERSEEQNTNIEIVVSNDSYKDNAYAMLSEGTGLNKISHRNAEAPMLYIPQDGEDFAIAFMDENTTVFPVNFKAMTTGKYNISLNATDDIRSLVLIDNQTGEKTNMLLEESYPFIGSPADKENRFMVRLELSHGDDENEQFVYQYGNELIIDGEGTLQVFDVLGRVVISEEVHGQRVDVSHLITGAYIVRMTGENVKTQKIIVR